MGGLWNRSRQKHPKIRVEQSTSKKSVVWANSKSQVETWVWQMIRFSLNYAERCLAKSATIR